MSGGAEELYVVTLTKCRKKKSAAIKTPNFFKLTTINRTTDSSTIELDDFYQNTTKHNELEKFNIDKPFFNI